MSKRFLYIAVLIILILFFSARPSFAQGWLYQNPYPTKNTLLAVKFVTPQKGWVAGEHGTILYTEDGGENWEAQESGTEEDLKSISFVNEKSGWAVGNGGVVIHTEDGGKNWVKQSDSRAKLHIVFFLNENEGWVGGSMGTFLHTRDGGKSWNKQDIGATGVIAGIFFKNSTTGRVISGDKVYRTKDSGKNWETSEISSIKLPTGGYVSPADHNWRWSVIFLDEKKGWAAFGYIFRTEDGGNTWQDQKVSKEVSVGGLSFLDKTTGWAVGKDGQIWKTRDGGKVWKMKSGYRPFVYFLDSKTAWGILRNHKSKKPGIAKTEDGGNTWKVQKTFDNDVNIRFFFVNATTGWAVGEEWGFDRSGSKLLNRFILNTNDGGKTWVTQFKDVAGEKWGVGDGLFDVFFIDQNEGWVVGSKDLILHTKDGGRHWANQNSGTKSDLWKVQFIDAKRGWAIGNKVVEGSGTSIILHTEDGGEHWYVQWKKKTDWMWLHQLQFIDENNGWVTGDINEYSGDRILLQTTNGGKTWTKREFRDIYFIQIFFIDKERGVILTEKDQMLITKDGGKTWDKQRIPIRRYPWHVSEVFKEK